MLALARKDSLGRIQFNAGLDPKVENDPVLGKVLVLPAQADSKKVKIRLAIPIQISSDPELAKRYPELTPGLKLIKDILKRLSDILEGEDLSFDMHMNALGSFYGAGPGEPLTFLLRGYKLLKNEQVMLITYKATCQRTGRDEIRVSHGINLKTGNAVVTGDVTLHQMPGARMDPDMGEYVCHF